MEGSNSLPSTYQIAQTVMERSDTFGAIDQKLLKSFTVDGKVNWEKGNRCHICNKKFGMRHRRHHCRWCGKSVCGRHSEKQRIYSEITNELERMCDQCDLEVVEGEIRLKLDEELGALKKREIKAHEEYRVLLREKEDK